MKALVVALALVGCGGDSAPVSCAEVGAAFAASFTRGRESMRDVVAERCHADDWSRAVRTCILEARPRANRACVDQMPPAQRRSLERAVKAGWDPYPEATPAAVAVEVTPPQPGVATLEIVSEELSDLDGRTLTDAVLDQELARLARQGRKRLIVKADSKAGAATPYRRVVDVLDRATKAGLDVELGAP